MDLRNDSQFCVTLINDGRLYHGCNCNGQCDGLNKSASLTTDTPMIAPKVYFEDGQPVWHAPSEGHRHQCVARDGGYVVRAELPSLVSG